MTRILSVEEMLEISNLKEMLESALKIFDVNYGVYQEQEDSIIYVEDIVTIEALYGCYCRVLLHHEDGTEEIGIFHGAFNTILHTILVIAETLAYRVLEHIQNKERDNVPKPYIDR